MEQLLYYNMGPDIEAFSTRKDSVLPYHVVQPHQVHGDKIAVVVDRGTSRDRLDGVDALVTNLTECSIGVRSADCVPILLYDKTIKLIAAVHSGWRGTTKRIVQKTISVMNREFGCHSMNLVAVIGPSIGPNSFIVHDDVMRAFSSEGFPMSNICKKISDGQYKIDLWGANKYLLMETGVMPQSIHTAGICSFKNHDEFFSARCDASLFVQ